MNIHAKVLLAISGLNIPIEYFSVNIPTKVLRVTQDLHIPSIVLF